MLTNILNISIKDPGSMSLAYSVNLSGKKNTNSLNYFEEIISSFNLFPFTEAICKKVWKAKVNPRLLGCHVGFRTFKWNQVWNKYWVLRRKAETQLHLWMNNEPVTLLLSWCKRGRAKIAFVPCTIPVLWSIYINGSKICFTYPCMALQRYIKVLPSVNKPYSPCQYINP